VSVAPRLVREKQRDSFYYKRQWRYDLTRVVATHSVAKDIQPSNYEIEIELCLDKDQVVHTSGKTLALSLLWKALDLVRISSGGALHVSEFSLHRVGL
jgi:hypothetical protein